MLRRFIHLLMYIYVYLGVFLYPNYTRYQMDDINTEFSFTIGFLCTEDFRFKTALPGYLLSVIYNLLLFITPSHVLTIMCAFRSP